MGMLRLLLALSVAYGHAGHNFRFQLVPGDTAVQTFYAISGFYMALVLDKTYASGCGAFYVSRALRLLPTYWAVLGATIATWGIAGFFGLHQMSVYLAWGRLPHIAPASIAFIALTQVFIVGQDIYNFLHTVGGNIVAGFDGRASLDNLSPIPQAWTLGVEIAFYAVAPFLLRRSTAVIVGTLCASVAVRLFLQFALGLAGDPWSYRFFPSEMSVFLCGALAYRVMTGSTATVVHIACAAAVCVSLLINRWTGGAGRVASIAFLAAAMAALPYLFRASQNWKLDRWIGDLSYPVYLSHFLVLYWVDLFLPSATYANLAVATLCTGLISVLILVAIEHPVSRLRHRLASVIAADRA